MTGFVLKRTIRIIAIVCCSLVAVIGISIGLSQIFTIREVQIASTGLSVEIDKSKLGNNLLLIPTERLTKDLLSNYPFLSSVRFERKFPGTLVIHLIKRQPFVILQSDRSRYYLDETGIVLDNATGSEGYTILRFPVGVFALGSSVTNKNVRTSLAFLRALGNKTHVSVMTIKDSASIQAYIGETNIFLPQEGDMQAKATTLQTIIEGFRIKGTLPTVIDLRFSKPIVTN